MWRSRKLRFAALFLLVSVLACVGTGLVLHEPRPSTGETGAAADALARELESAVDRDAFEATRAFEWRFGGRHDLIWDRDRGLASVTFSDKRALFRVGDQQGLVFTGDEWVRDPENVAKAYSIFINDSYWLNPAIKSFDEGVTRSVVEVEGGRGLLIEYASGGVTPGDAYLWILDGNGLPREWQMWVSIIPIGGVRASWDDFIETTTGAKISTRHEIGPMTLRLENVRGEASLRELIGPAGDPFEPLVRAEIAEPLQ